MEQKGTSASSKQPNTASTDNSVEVLAGVVPLRILNAVVFVSPFLPLIPPLIISAVGRGWGVAALAVERLNKVLRLSGWVKPTGARLSEDNQG